MLVSREISEVIHQKLEDSATVFSRSQEVVKASCPKDCGKCCFYPDIRCSPFELIPLAYYLYDRGLALEVLDKLTSTKTPRCVLLNVQNEETGKGSCGHYLYRPFICRAFGVYARHGKNNKKEVSSCKILATALDLASESQKDDVALIDDWRQQLVSVGPYSFDEEIPINEAIKVALEAVLLKESYRE